MKIEVPVTRRHIHRATPKDSMKNPLCLAIKTELKRRGIANSFIYDGRDCVSYYIERGNNRASKMHQFLSDLPEYVKALMNKYRQTGKLEPFTVVLDFQYFGKPLKFVKDDNAHDSSEQSVEHDDSGVAVGTEIGGSGAADEATGNGAV